jgi:hypothetical protein
MSEDTSTIATWYKILSSTLLVLLIGCSQTVKQSSELTNLGEQANQGFATADYLNTLYGRRFPNCNKSNSQPAFLCSGVTIRVTVKGTNYKVGSLARFQ